MRYVPAPRRRALVYAAAALALAVYGIPRIPALAPGVAGTFSMVWILFAALAIASNLYFLVGADRERGHQLAEGELRPAQRPAVPGRERGLRRRAL
ncbi:hypothetical protein GCM10025857_29090 [Alicyclobacillus contaminans]|nr:hypothetical protein GCM10025857_29090 [Alicyclobacillus contaminans]